MMTNQNLPLFGVLVQAKPKIWVLPISEEDLVVPQFYLEPPIAIDGFNNAPFSWLQDPKVSAQTKQVIDGYEKDF